MTDQIATQKEKLKEIIDGIEQGILKLFDSEKYKQYLRTMSKFPRYSLNNTILIFLQNPNATFVAGFGRWQEQFERHVRKGEKGIKIIAPAPYHMKKEVDKVDPVTRKPVVDTTGKVMKEEVEVKIPMFKPVTVFDVSQTEGKPLPELVSSLEGDVNGYQTFMEALKRTAPVPITFEDMKESVDGYFSNAEQRIALRSGMSEVQTVSAAIHEIAHSVLHNKELIPIQTEEKDQVIEEIKSRRTKEVEAESVSYAVFSYYYGIEINENSFSYIASWSKDKELSELKASLELINQTASSLITEIDEHLAKLQEEKSHEVKILEENVLEEANKVVALPDSYWILQLNLEEDLRDYRFESLERLEEMGLRVEEVNYHEVYEGMFTDEATTNVRLHALFEQFNFHPPKDFTGHSLSVSDIVALREHNVISYYYVDRIGFQQLPGFNAKDNPLRSFEDIVEQNDNNLDGIINNLPPVKEPDSKTERNQLLVLREMDQQDAAKQKDKKKSVREKLQQSPIMQPKRNVIEIADGRNGNESINL